MATRGRDYATTLYAAPKGNLVFHAGTCWWNLVLATPLHRYVKEPDPRLQRITKNILNRMIAVAPAER